MKITKKSKKKCAFLKILEFLISSIRGKNVLDDGVFNISQNSIHDLDNDVESINYYVKLENILYSDISVFSTLALSYWISTWRIKLIIP